MDIHLKVKIIHTSLRYLNINWRLDKSSLNLSLMNLIKLSEALETILKANKIPEGQLDKLGKNIPINVPINSGTDLRKRGEQLQKYYLLNFDVTSSATSRRIEPPASQSEAEAKEQIKIIEQTLIRLPESIYNTVFSNKELDTFNYIFPELKSKAWSENWAKGIKILQELARPEMVLEDFFIDEVIEKTMQNLQKVEDLGRVS